MFPVTPPIFGESLGRISDDAVIYVPAESLQAYKAIPALSAYEVRPFTAESGIIIPDKDVLTLMTTTDGTITINGAAPDEYVKIIRLDGTLVYHGTDKTVNSLSPGYYIVTVNNTTFKTAVH